ncbi:MAG: 50S ribosomal protein L35 [Patescibacteria group bacterium]|nr:50S ribosomal protein L35 [Patescibacteria group bacterium]MDD4304566.1 50S ribosomal protein L35 [Patescibacteria group bacterium]MDD4695753.1 50S ribosomal protein L35 [Patescibacteria group bacterium]
MGKLKTFKALTKRVKITKSGKIIARAKGQDHFNTTESGNKTRNKRRDKSLSKSISKNMKKYL